MSNLTEKDVKELINLSGEKKENKKKSTRTNLIIGVGDCGNSITNVVVKERKWFPSIIYNTSDRNSDSMGNVTKKVYINTSDGSGRNPDVAKSLMRTVGINHITNLINDYVPLKNVYVAHSYGGGTASSAINLAGYLYDVLNRDSEKINVISIGVLPKNTEDIMYHKLSLLFYNNIQKLMGMTTEIPRSLTGYLLFDNEKVEIQNLIKTYDVVNNEIKVALEMLDGFYFGNSTICIDSADLDVIVNNGGRITAHYKEYDKVKSSVTIRDLIGDLIGKSTQLPPDNPSKIGLFLKGPKEFISSLDFTINDALSDYLSSEPSFAPIHLEVSDVIGVGLITSGNLLPRDRFSKMEKRSNDVAKIQEESQLFTVELDNSKTKKRNSNIDYLNL